MYQNKTKQIGRKICRFFRMTGM